MEVITSPYYGVEPGADAIAFNSSLHISSMVFWLYVSGIIFGLSLIASSFRKIGQISRKYQSLNLNNVRLYQTNEQGTPFFIFPQNILEPKY